MRYIFMRIRSNGIPLTMSTWVDNLFFTGTSLTAVRHNVDTVQQHFQIQWGLDFKSGSVEYMVPKGSFSETDPLVKPHLLVLGHTVTAKADSHMIVAQLVRAVRLVVFMNAKSAHFKALCPDKQCLFLNRLCLPHLHWYAPALLFNRTLVDTINAAQRWVALQCWKCRRQFGEYPGAFKRRRHMSVGFRCAQIGLWSRVIATRLVKWDKHVQKAADATHRLNRPWYVFLIHFRDEQWINERRTRYGDRTNTRAWFGCPAPRFEASIRADTEH